MAVEKQLTCMYVYEYVFMYESMYAGCACALLCSLMEKVTKAEDCVLTICLLYFYF